MGFHLDIFDRLLFNLGFWLTNDLLGLSWFLDLLKISGGCSGAIASRVSCHLLISLSSIRSDLLLLSTSCICGVLGIVVVRLRRIKHHRWLVIKGREGDKLTPPILPIKSNLLILYKLGRLIKYIKALKIDL